LQAQHWNIPRFATHESVNQRKIHFLQIKVTYTSEPFYLRLLGNFRKKIIDTMVNDPYIVEILIKPMVKYGIPSMHSGDTCKNLEVVFFKKRRSKMKNFIIGYVYDRASQ
jgi:hypothetical protein